MSEAVFWYEKGVQAERERIIKLLEGTYSIALEKNEFDLLDFLIALIKGDGKSSPESVENLSEGENK